MNVIYNVHKTENTNVMILQLYGSRVHKMYNILPGVCRFLDDYFILIELFIYIK